MKNSKRQHKAAIRRYTSGVRNRTPSELAHLKSCVDRAFDGWLQRRGYTNTTMADVIATDVEAAR